jgi:hypothetical protein
VKISDAIGLRLGDFGFLFEKLAEIRLQNGKMVVSIT